MDPREKRLAENEALFREVNERVQEAASPGWRRLRLLLRVRERRLHLPDHAFPPEYERVRGDPKQFVVLPDHYTPEIEDLVAQHGTHWIVRKQGDAGEYVEQLDPRSR